jgi:hypothetical protein
MGIVTSRPAETFEISLSGSSQATQITFHKNVRTAYLEFVQFDGRLEMSGTSSGGVDGAALVADYEVINSDGQYALELASYPVRHLRGTDVFVASEGAASGSVLRVRTSAF